MLHVFSGPGGRIDGLRQMMLDLYDIVTDRTSDKWDKVMDSTSDGLDE